jgi:hypothetical protein
MAAKTARPPDANRRASALPDTLRTQSTASGPSAQAIVAELEQWQRRAADVGRAISVLRDADAGEAHDVLLQAFMGAFDPPAQSTAETVSGYLQ